MPPVVAPTPELKTCVIKATPQARWSKAESHCSSDIGDINYVWDTFTALAQHDAGKFQSYARSDVPPMKPHLAFQATLNLVRQFHALSIEKFWSDPSLI